MATLPAFLLGVAVTMAFWVYVIGDRARGERIRILQALWRIERWQIRLHRFYAEGKPLPKPETEDTFNGDHQPYRQSK